MSKLQYLDLPEGKLANAEKLDQLIGSKAKAVISCKSMKDGYLRLDDRMIFVDESREGIPVVGLYRIHRIVT